MKIDKFNVRIVRTGDSYGLNFCLTHGENAPLVEFYDSRYAHTEFGQFISSYYVSTILESDKGLCLEGSEAEWSVSADDMAAVRAWLKKEVTA